MIKNGMKLETIEKNVPTGKDGLEATRIVVAIHKSLMSGNVEFC